jgi:hypothetical protein
MTATEPTTAPVSLAERLAELGDPVVFVRRRISWTLRSNPPSMRPDIIDAALEEFVTACLAWRPDGDYELGAYVTLRLQSKIPRATARLTARRHELGRQRCLSDAEWMAGSSDGGIDASVDRVDLQRWADLAELSPTMRWGVEHYAFHGSPRDRDRWYDAARAGLRYMRLAAKTNRRRDDHWTRARAGARGDDHAELHRLYIDEGLTLAEIAERTGHGPVTIARRLRAGGTVLRPPGGKSPNRADERRP